MTTRPDVSLLDVSSYLPGEPIGADYYAEFAGSDELRDNVMFRGPSLRHHVGAERPAMAGRRVSARRYQLVHQARRR